MSQLHSAIRYGHVSIALFDSLLKQLQKNGVLGKSDVDKIIARAGKALSNHPDPNVSASLELLKVLYLPPG